MKTSSNIDVRSNIPKSFLTFFPFPYLDYEFGNPQYVKKLIDNFVNYKINEARREGFKEALSKIEESAKKQVNGYINLVTRVADFVINEAPKLLEKAGFRIIETRTKFHFDTREISLLFITDSSLEDEITFSNFLMQTEKDILRGENFVAELFSINKRDVDLDYDSINNDYPAIKTKRKVNAK